MPSDLRDKNKVPGSAVTLS